MKSLVLTGLEEMDVRDVETPDIKEDEVLVKVKYCGICGTDVHIFHGEPGSAEVTPPTILGHEFAGEVIDTGSNVSHLKVGDHVAVDPNIYCGKCKYCRQGRVQLCEDLSAIGVTQDGGMAEYCAVPEAACLTLNPELSFKAGAMVEPLSCVLHGFDQIDEITHETNVLIIGGGFIGSLFLQAIQLKNPACVDVCEINKNKHELLSELGADNVYASTDEISEKYDLVVECAGLKVTSEAAIDLADNGGNILLFGVPSPGTEITVPAFDIFNKELKIAGSLINPFTLSEAVQLLNTGAIQVDSLFSHVLSLEEVPEVLDNYGNLGVSKAVIDLAR